MKVINIWSGCDIGIGAALTNPTELAFRKGKLKNHYPVEFNGKVFRDAESAYQKHKIGHLQQDMTIMTKIIVAKLQQHPGLLKIIAKYGGVAWLEQCSHIVGVRGSRWEGVGRKSNFIQCLISAYILVC